MELRSEFMFIEHFAGEDDQQLISTYCPGSHSIKEIRSTGTWIKDHSNNIYWCSYNAGIVLYYFFYQCRINISASIGKYVKYQFLTGSNFQVFIQNLRYSAESKHSQNLSINSYVNKLNNWWKFPSVSWFTINSETSLLRSEKYSWLTKFFKSITLIVEQFISFHTFEYLSKYFIWEPNHPKH